MRNRPFFSSYISFGCRNARPDPLVYYYGRKFLLFCLLLLFPIAAQAEHTPEHRFTIYGFVYDNTGKPVPGTVVVKDTTDHVLATTDAGRSGYYEFHIHLHNSNVGDRLLIHSEAGEKEFIVQFDPNDKITERKAEVNFGVIPPSSGFVGNRPLLFAVALTLAAGTVYVVMRRRNSRKSQTAKKKQRHRQEA